MMGCKRQDCLVLSCTSILVPDVPATLPREGLPAGMVDLGRPIVLLGICVQSVLHAFILGSLFDV